jgi:uncharacterized protein YdhG (YjbR/CyaY superfamily)
MARTDFKSVDQYLASQPPKARAVLTTVRKTIRAAVPDAEEVISYQLPAYKLDGSFVVYFGGFTNHFSLSFPPPLTVFGAFKEQLARYKTSKSAVNIPLDEPVPTKLVAALAKFRAQQAVERAKAAKPKAKATTKTKVTKPKRKR